MINGIAIEGEAWSDPRPHPCWFGTWNTPTRSQHLFPFAEFTQISGKLLKAPGRKVPCSITAARLGLGLEGQRLGTLPGHFLGDRELSHHCERALGSLGAPSGTRALQLQGQLGQGICEGMVLPLLSDRLG